MRESPATILLSSVADPYLWEALVSAGAFDVLTRPFRESEAVSMIEFAFTHWKTGKPAGGPCSRAALAGYALAHRVQNEFGAAVEIELLEDIAAVRLRRVEAQVQRFATSLLLLPSASSCSTSRSRVVSSS